MPGLKTVVENVMFCLKEGQDFGNQAAHPHQEFLGVPPGRIVYFTRNERIHARWLVESIVVLFLGFRKNNFTPQHGQRKTEF